MGWTGGYVLLALLLAPYLRKFGKFTVPDFIGDRYYSNTARSVAVFCALLVAAEPLHINTPNPSKDKNIHLYYAVSEKKSFNPLYCSS